MPPPPCHVRNAHHPSCPNPRRRVPRPRDAPRCRPAPRGRARAPAPAARLSARVRHRDGHPALIDCLWASASMMLDKWTNGDVRVTHGELRRLSGDRGGSSLEDLQVVFRKLGLPTSPSTQRAQHAHLGRRCWAGCGTAPGRWCWGYGDLPRWHGRWDYAFWKKKGKKDNHAVYVERYDRKHGRVWLMDPLAHGAWRGEWISIWALRHFAWSSGGRVAAVVTPTAKAAPFANVSVAAPEMRPVGGGRHGPLAAARTEAAGPIPGRTSTPASAAWTHPSRPRPRPPRSHPGRAPMPLLHARPHGWTGGPCARLPRCPPARRLHGRA